MKNRGLSASAGITLTKSPISYQSRAMDVENRTESDTMPVSPRIKYAPFQKEMNP